MSEHEDAGDGRDPAKALAAARLALTTLLTRRETSTGDARARLTAKGHALEHVDTAIAEFERAGLLDDARFARHYVEFHASRGDGPFRLREALRALHLPEPLIEESLDRGTLDWAALCEQARRRKFGAARPTALKDKARQARFLQYRGYSSDHIGSALGYHIQLDDSPPDE